MDFGRLDTKIAVMSAIDHPTHFNLDTWKAKT